MINQLFLSSKIIVLCFFVFSAKAQQQEPHKIKYYGANDKFAGSNVRSIIEDYKGFLWVATQDGLYRSTSPGFISYNSGGNIKHTIVGTDVKSILEIKEQQRLYVFTAYGGISIIDINTGNVIKRISFFKSNPQANAGINYCVLKNQYIFIATTKGLFRFNINTEIIESVLEDNNVNILNDVQILLFADKSIIGYDKVKGFFSLNRQSNQKRFICNFITTPLQKQLNIYNAIGFEEGKWLIATSNGIKKITISTEGQIAATNFLSSIKEVSNNETYALSFDKQNNLWIANNRNVLKLLPTKDTTVVVIKGTGTDIEKQWLSSIYKIFVSPNGTIWLGGQQGLALCDNSKPIFESISQHENNTISHAYFIKPYSDTLFDVCTPNGFCTVNRVTGDILKIGEKVSFDFIFTDPYKRKIISSEKGLFVLQPIGLTPIAKIYKEFASFEKWQINSFITLSDSIIILGTENYNGILEWNYKKHRVKNWRKEEKFNVLPENEVNNLYKINADEFCILGDSYVSHIYFKSKKVETLKFSNNSFRLFFDVVKVANNYYLSSYGSGIIKLDNNFKQTDLINTQSGLSNNGIYKILNWKDSLLFITTNDGLNIYNNTTKSINHYYKSDGLHGNVFEETSGNVLNNLLYAGGKGGVTIMHPLNIVQNHIPPTVYFGEINMKMSASEVKDTFNLDAQKIVIDNYVAQTDIHFSGINYSNPERVTFNYRITEQSPNWINLNTQNFITLIAQSPGTYHLQVKAANEDGVWSEPKELILEFLPKWYQTWWFKVLVFLITASIVYAFYRYRIRQIEKQHAIRKNIATDLHDDLGSTLNSVKVFTNLAISGVKQEESLQQVKDNLTEATMSLRDMIWVLDDSLDTVDELVTRLKQFAIPITAASNMEFVINANSDVNSRTLTKEEKRNLFLICKEAINNSIKYSGAAQVTVDIAPAGKKIQITVADNGKGFDEANVKKGYGLKNMQYRATQIKYATSLHSFENSGTQIKIVPG